MHLAIAAQADWGLYWVRVGAQYPAQSAACHHNANMSAMHILAMEAVS